MPLTRVDMQRPVVLTSYVPTESAIHVFIRRNLIDVCRWIKVGYPIHAVNWLRSRKGSIRTITLCLKLKQFKKFWVLSSLRQMLTLKPYWNYCARTVNVESVIQIAHSGATESVSHAVEDSRCYYGRGCTYNNTSRTNVDKFNPTWETLGS